MAKAKSKKQQLQDLKQREHDKKFIKTAKKKKKIQKHPIAKIQHPDIPVGI